MDNEPIEATNMEEALAPCADCSAVFPSPHRAGCPQIEAQEKIAKEREGKKVIEEQVSPHKALCMVKAYMCKIESMLNPELLKMYQHDSVHCMVDDLIKIAGMSKDEARQEIESREKQ